MADEARLKAFAKLVANGAAQIHAYDIIWPERTKTAAPASRKANAQRYFQKPLVQRLIRAEHGRIETAIAPELNRKLKELKVSKNYVTGALLEVVERCMQAVPVLDKKGEEIGVWKFDAPSTIRALELLGTDIGQFQKTHKLLHGKADPLEGTSTELTQRIGILLDGMGAETKLAVLRLVLNNLDAEQLTGIGYQRIPKIVEQVGEQTIEITSGEAS